MAKYCAVENVFDAQLKGIITEDYLLVADVRLDAELTKLGFKPADITLPNPLLTQIAVFMAMETCCLGEAQGEDSQLLKKADGYKAQYQPLLDSLVLDGLGVEGGADDVYFAAI